jgi:putative transposase
MSRRSRAKPPSPFRCFNSSAEVIRLAVMMYVRFPLSLRNVADLLFERGIDICHETVRMWWNRFGPMFAGDAWDVMADAVHDTKTRAAINAAARAA